jgi:hypothetical protein
MDSFRQSILNRVSELSSRRGLTLQASGGNAVINPRALQHQAPATSILTAPKKSRPLESTVWPLENRAWNKPVSTVIADPQNPARMQLGQNLLPMGHLESHYLFDAPDRSWIASGTQTIVTSDSAPSGKNVMQLVVPAGQEKGTIGMRTFEYTFEPGTPSSFVLAARTDAPAIVTAYQQWRKRDENRLEALETAKLRAIGQQELSAGGWQELRFDFDSPRVTAISYRVVLVVAPLDASQDHHSWFDDIALIEWLSPPLNDGVVPAQVANKLASHAGFVTR